MPITGVLSESCAHRAPSHLQVRPLKESHPMVALEHALLSAYAPIALERLFWIAVSLFHFLLVLLLYIGATGCTHSIL
jgi:hypothetical protein